VGGGAVPEKIIGVSIVDRCQTLGQLQGIFTDAGVLQILSSLVVEERIDGIAHGDGLGELGGEMSVGGIALQQEVGLEAFGPGPGLLLGGLPFELAILAVAQVFPPVALLMWLVAEMGAVGAVTGYNVDYHA
jgi:hypothetical protein